MLAEAVLDAEVKMGELLKKIQKKLGKRTDLEPFRTYTEKLNTKTEITVSYIESAREKLQTVITELRKAEKRAKQA